MTRTAISTCSLVLSSQYTEIFNFLHSKQNESKCSWESRDATIFPRFLRLNRLVGTIIPTPFIASHPDR